MTTAVYRHGASELVRTRLGIERRRAFAHDVFYLDKHYADQLLALERRGVPRELALSGEHLQINVYTHDTGDLPDDLLWDGDVNWHLQQQGRPGLIAAAGLWLPEPDALGNTAIVTFLQSDIVTQVGKHRVLGPRYRGVVDTRFDRWCPILLNALMDFALVRRLRRLLIPTSETILVNTKKRVQPMMYERTYDEASRRYRSTRVWLSGVSSCEPGTPGASSYWLVEPGENSDRIARLETRTERVPAPQRSICVCHDTEESVDTAVSDELCRRHLLEMLEVERAAGARSTYNVLGKLFRAKAPVIAAAGPHALAFHSFDHDRARLDQLSRVRQVDLQVKGYRPPNSTMTEELTDARLVYLNFEWLACSRKGLGSATATPFLSRGIVKLPISTDDWPLHCRAPGAETYETWRDGLLSQVERSGEFFAFGLHDCYASAWISEYPTLLRQLARFGEFETCDEVAARLFLCSSSERRLHGS